MALIANGVTLTSSGNLDATKLTGNLPALNASSLTNVPSSAPTTSQVLSATAGASVGAVGTYACVRNENNSNYSAGNTISGSLSWGSNGDGWYSGNLSGTWRVMGQVRSNDNNNEGKSTVMLRIS